VLEGEDMAIVDFFNWTNAVFASDPTTLLFRCASSTNLGITQILILKKITNTL